MVNDWNDRIIMVIPSINGGHLLERMLPTLRFRPSNVIVLDQGSSDDTERICQGAGVELLQLGRPHTYTQACNIGAQIARQRSSQFLCVSNNDIIFRTDVLRELLGEMERDPRLGIVAPSQIILDAASGVNVLARRVFWNLETVEFLHDLDASLAPPRMEADFCELTCALIRMSALNEVGFLDDAFGFYYEDADFCFRLRKAGYGAAYLPQSQIYHFTSSTFSLRRQTQIDYMRRNRALFASKHLGYGVRQVEDQNSRTDETEITARRLRPVLRRFGLIDDERPDLLFGRMSAMTTDYLFTLQRRITVQKHLLPLRDRYRAILATSDAVVHSLRSESFTSFHVPLGIDPDIFNPWGSVLGPVTRRFDETTYLAIADSYDYRPLATILRAWNRFVALGRKARLIVVGSRLAHRMGRTADAAYRSGRVEIFCFAAEQLEMHEIISPLPDEELALLYRSADFTIITAAEGSSLTILESLGSGTPVVFDAACGSVSTLYQDATGGAASLHTNFGAPLPSGDVATSTDGLLAALERSRKLNAGERGTLAMGANYGILSNSTLRHTAMALRGVLEATQECEPDRFVRLVDRQMPSPPKSEILVQQSGAPPPLRSRLSGAAARLLTTTAGLATRFGVVWQDKGLRAAVALSASRIKLAALPRLRPTRRTSQNAAAISAGSAFKAASKKASPLLIGYIDAQLGIGQSLRGLAIALAEAGMPFSIYPFGIGVEGRRSIPAMPERYDEVTPHDINVIEVSPAELPRVFNHVSEDHFEGSYNILRTYWELAKGPVLWRQNHCMDRIDEIWAPNAFCANAFRDFFDGPIVIVPPCLDIGTAPPNLTQDRRSRFGLNPDTFYFMFSFDYHSFPDRKNPLAAIRAFRTAFPDNDRPIGLVVKTSSAQDHFPVIKKEILAAARADGRITIIDASLPRQDMLSLMTSIDCYVSLHRSEGFGLGMAEAMALEKPVIATNYSGNCEFVTETTGYPIAFKLIPVRPHEYVYTEGQVWADPDEDACSAAMRDVINKPGQAASRAKAGRAFVNNRYGAQNVGRLAVERLEDIRLTRLAKTTVGSTAT